MPFKTTLLIIPINFTKNVVLCQEYILLLTFLLCCVTIDVRLLELKKDLNPDIILITQKKPIRKDLDL